MGTVNMTASARAKACIDCGASPVMARGFCRRCYVHRHYLANKAAYVARAAAWQRENREAFNAGARARYPFRREKAQAATERWRKANPEKVRNSRENARARQRAAFVEKVDRVVIYETYGGVCGICARSLQLAKMQLDHIMPLSKGGLHEYANVQPSHEVCNKRKAASLP